MLDSHLNLVEVHGPMSEVAQFAAMQARAQQAVARVARKLESRLKLASQRSSQLWPLPLPQQAGNCATRRVSSSNTEEHDEFIQSGEEGKTAAAIFTPRLSGSRILKS